MYVKAKQTPTWLHSTLLRKRAKAIFRSRLRVEWLNTDQAPIATPPREDRRGGRRGRCRGAEDVGAGEWWLWRHVKALPTKVESFRFRHARSQAA